MEKQHKEPAPSWKGCIGFGVVNIVLVLLCTKLSMVLLSTGMLLLLAVGVAVAVQSIKEDWKAGFTQSAIGCGLGLGLHVVATVLYGVNVLSSLVALVRRLPIW